MKNKRLYIFLAVLLSIVILLVNWQILAVHANISSKISRAIREPDVNGWRQISLPPEIPGPREGSALAYDSIRGVTVLFGGCSTEDLGDTWEWNGVTWTQRFPANSPSPRCFHTMAFDSARGVVVLFGGIDQGGFQNDTWEWDENNWIQRTPANYPPARMASAMVYDSAREVTVLFGGHACRDDTWEWDGNNWIQRLPANSPPCRYSHAMVYDSKRGVTVLFGGYTGQLIADTWEWDGINWVERQPVNYPQARFRHAMAYDSDRGITVLFGGMLDSILSDETWEWNGSNWKECTLEVKPSARIYHAMAYEISRHVTVLLAGWDGINTLGDTWEYTGEAPFYIYGRVTDGYSNPVGGVTVNISNSFTATTNSSGYYSFTNLITGTYTLTPFFDQYSFLPDMRVVNVPPDAIDQDFTAIPPIPTATPTPTSTHTPTTTSTPTLAPTPTDTPTLTSTATDTSTPSLTPTTTSSPTPTRTPLRGYLSILLKPIPPSPTPTTTPSPTITPQAPSAPNLNPIDNSDQDNFYSISWGTVYNAENYYLEEATDPSFTSTTVIYEGSGTNWAVPSPGKTPASYYYRVKGGNIWGISTWSNVQPVTIHPLFVGLDLSWDGMGYIRGSEYYDVGYHITRYLDELTQGYIIRSDNSAWYDPNPYDWPPSYWFSYYSATSGDFLSSSVPPDPSWKWEEPWILPYNLQFHTGQTVEIDSQDFLVSGPFSGYTAFGVPVQFWELVNKHQFVYWDGGGDWKQYVYSGDIVLRYDAGNTRLELYSSILRHDYYQGDPTSDTVQYIVNLTAANSFPGSLVLLLPLPRPHSVTMDWFEIDTSKLPGPRD